MARQTHNESHAHQLHCSFQIQKQSGSLPAHCPNGWFQWCPSSSYHSFVPPTATFAAATATATAVLVVIVDDIRMYYSHTHGLNKSPAHTSATCPHPGAEHKPGAMITHMIGGNNRIMGHPQQPHFNSWKGGRRCLASTCWPTPSSFHIFWRDKKLEISILPLLGIAPVSFLLVYSQLFKGTKSISRCRMDHSL